jgi:predicted phosphodiesterase
MRLAVVSDIHGNLHALEAVLADLCAQAPDLTLNLGDHLSGPLQAAATADLLMAQRDWVQIRGNHDRQMIEQESDAMGLSDRAAHEQATDAHRAWLRSLPVVTVADDVLLCHGTPERDDEYLLEDVSTSGARLASREEIRSRIDPKTKVVVCGHSHIPRFVQVDDDTVAVNAGSVGLQAYHDSEHRCPHVIETGSPHARYMLLDRAGRGWRATLRVIDYDWDAAAQLARKNGRRDWAHALVTGHALR